MYFDVILIALDIYAVVSLAGRGVAYLWRPLSVPFLNEMKSANQHVYEILICLHLYIRLIPSKMFCLSSSLKPAMEEVKYKYYTATSKSPALKMLLK